MAFERLSLSIRARVIWAVIVLTGLALLLSGVVIVVQGEVSTERRVATDLSRAADEFTQMASGNDPATAAPFTGAETLLRHAMQRTVLPPTEGLFAILDGRIRWTAQEAVPLRPEDDPELVAAMLGLGELNHVSEGSLTTAIREYRYLVVPVQWAEGEPAGALVRVADMDQERALLAPVFNTYALVATGALLLVGMVIWLITGRLLRPLSWIRETAERINETDITQRITVRGHDDLSALAITVNAMLDRLEAAIGAQRDLLDDVGHELRTPLTILRGHLELVDPSDPDEVSATRALVLDEVDRMSRLVDDLLTLAKAEHPDFVIRQATDIGRLTDETLAKASGLGDRRWLLEELADAEVNLDPQRITQAWLQLAANAVAYSAAATSVGLGSRLGSGELALWVRDEGVGIEADELLRVGSRKVRGQVGDGVGLGLAIVNSITAAHNGRLEIESNPGVGTRVTMFIPTNLEDKLEPDPDS